MWKTLPNIDDLIKNHIKIHFFGLGFIQVKMNRIHRYHFYSAKLPAFVEDAHNHRYDFVSWILKGKLLTNIYTFTPNVSPSYYLTKVSCDPNKPAPEEKIFGSKNFLCQFESVAGSEYSLLDETFHTVTPIDDTITFIQRDEPRREFADVILPASEQSVCPFSKSIPDSELWEIIREML